jgi:hypothetical protein
VKAKSGLTPRAPDKCGLSPTLAGKRPQTADSAPGGFIRQIPPLPVTPAVGPPKSNACLYSFVKCGKLVLASIAQYPATPEARGKELESRR